MKSIEFHEYLAITMDTDGLVLAPGTVLNTHLHGPMCLWVIEAAKKSTHCGPYGVKDFGQHWFK